MKFKCNIIYNNSNVHITFPCSNKDLYESLRGIGVPKNELSRIPICIDDIDNPALKGLKYKVVDPDELNYLAQKLDSMTDNEVRKFSAVAEKYSMKNIVDLINLTENMHYYTLIQDISDLETVGRQHILTREQAIPASDLEKYNLKEIGRQLTESGEGEVTKYGILYTNNDLEYYRPYKGGAIPFFLYTNERPVGVCISYNGASNYVFLPEVEEAIDRAVYRLGAKDIRECKLSIEHCDFQFIKSRANNLMEGNQDLMNKYLDRVLQSEGIIATNSLVSDIQAMPQWKRPYLPYVIEYAEVRTSRSIGTLIDNIDCFAVFGDVNNATDLGRAIIDSNDDYVLHEDIEDFFDYERFGDSIDTDWNGAYLDNGIYVGVKESTLEEILEQYDQEPGIELSEM